LFISDLLTSILRLFFILLIGEVIVFSLILFLLIVIGNLIVDGNLIVENVFLLGFADFGSTDSLGGCSTLSPKFTLSFNSEKCFNRFSPLLSVSLSDSLVRLLCFFFSFSFFFLKYSLFFSTRLLTFSIPVFFNISRVSLDKRRENSL